VISSFSPPHWLLFKCSHGVFSHKSIKDKANLLIVKILSTLLISYVFDLPSLVPSWNKRILNYVVSNIFGFVDKYVVKKKTSFFLSWWLLFFKGYEGIFQWLLLQDFAPSRPLWMTYIAKAHKKSLKKRSFNLIMNWLFINSTLDILNDIMFSFEKILLKRVTFLFGS
jgi:hypothetical protein